MPLLYSVQQLPKSLSWVFWRKHAARHSLLGGHLRVHFHLTRISIRIALTSHGILRSKQKSQRKIQCLLFYCLHSLETSYLWILTSESLCYCCMFCHRNVVICRLKFNWKPLWLLCSIHFNNFLSQKLDFSERNILLGTLG